MRSDNMAPRKTYEKPPLNYQSQTFDQAPVVIIINIYYYSIYEALVLLTYMLLKIILYT